MLTGHKDYTIEFEAKWSITALKNAKKKKR